MKIEIQKTAGLTSYSAQIEEVVRRTLSEVEDKLSLGDVEVVVKETNHPEGIKEIGSN